MRSLLIAGVMATALVATGCVYSEVGGAIWTDVKGPIAPASAVGTGKTGTSCSNTILGIIATGDASIEAAKRNGKITKVTSVDHHSKWMVVYGEFCTIVTGE
jgi:hypothetical protein